MKTKLQDATNQNKAEELLSPIRFRLKEARRAHNAWQELQDRIAESRSRINALEELEHQLIVDLTVEPQFAGKKVSEHRMTGEIIRHRIPLLENLAKEPFKEFQNTIEWLVFGYPPNYDVPASEVHRRRWERVRIQAKVELNLVLTTEQTTARVERIPDACRIDLPERFVSSDRFNCTPEECVRILTQLETVFPYIEQLVTNEVELLNDTSLDEIPTEPEPSIDLRQYIAWKTVPVAKANVYVAADNLHVMDIREDQEGGDFRFAAGDQLVTLSKRQLEKLVKSGQAITLAEFERRQALKGAHSQWQDGQVKPKRDIFAPVEKLARA